MSFSLFYVVVVLICLSYEIDFGVCVCVSFYISFEFHPKSNFRTHVATDLVTVMYLRDYLEKYLRHETAKLDYSTDIFYLGNEGEMQLRHHL